MKHIKIFEDYDGNDSSFEEKEYDEIDEMRSKSIDITDDDIKWIKKFHDKLKIPIDKLEIVERAKEGEIRYEHNKERNINIDYPFSCRIMHLMKYAGGYFSINVNMFSYSARGFGKYYLCDDLEGMYELFTFVKTEGYVYSPDNVDKFIVNAGKYGIKLDDKDFSQFTDEQRVAFCKGILKNTIKENTVLYKSFLTDAQINWFLLKAIQ